MWSYKRCPNGRHSYKDGFCSCGQMSRAEFRKIRRKTRVEIMKYELGRENAKKFYKEMFIKP